MLKGRQSIGKVPYLTTPLAPITAGVSQQQPMHGACPSEWSTLLCNGYHDSEQPSTSMGRARFKKKKKHGSNGGVGCEGQAFLN